MNKQNQSLVTDKQGEFEKWSFEVQNYGKLSIDYKSKQNTPQLNREKLKIVSMCRGTALPSPNQQKAIDVKVKVKNQCGRWGTGAEAWRTGKERKARPVCLMDQHERRLARPVSLRDQQEMKLVMTVEMGPIWGRGRPSALEDGKPVRDGWTEVETGQQANGV